MRSFSSVSARATATLAMALLAARPAAAQLLDPQAVDNRQPSFGLVQFIDDMGFVRMTSTNFVPTGYRALDGSVLGLPDLIGRTIVGATATTPPGTVLGSATTTITSDNFPVSQGGLAQPLDNRQPGVALRYAIRVSGGVYPTADYRAGLSSIGAVAAFAGTTLPDGWMFAEGQSLVTADNLVLFSLMGVIFGGIRDDSPYVYSTFNLPDFRGRVPIASGRSVFGEFDLGEESGSDFETLFNQNVPAVLGGNGFPFSNYQPTLGMSYQVAVFGRSPIVGDNCPCAANAALPFLGEVNMYAWERFNSYPAFRADGSLVSIDENADLFDLIDTRYGGDGQNTFALPNLEGRLVVGAGQSAVNASRAVEAGDQFGVGFNSLVAGAAPPVTTVPEPATLALFAAGMAGLGLATRRRRA